jgi:acetyl esterase/lipase
MLRRLQPDETYGGAQFPEPCALLSRPSQGLPEVRLGIGGTTWRQKLAPDAQQFGNAPPFLVTFGALQRLVDRGQRLVGGATLAQCMCELTEKSGKVHDKPGLAQGFERIAQERQAGGEITALDQQDPPETRAARAPSAQWVFRGVIDQLVCPALGSGKVEAALSAAE